MNSNMNSDTVTLKETAEMISWILNRVVTKLQCNIKT